MPRLTEVMEQVAQMLRDGGVTRPVVTDPRNVSMTPCVLVEPPTMRPGGVVCASGVIWRHNILAIGLAGAGAEIEPLAVLVDDIVTALNGAFDLAEPIAYVPLSPVMAAEPVQAYRIQVEVFA